MSVYLDALLRLPCLFRRSFKTTMLSRFSKVAITASDFMNKIYNGGLTPEFNVSMLKEIIALVEDRVCETKKQKAKLAEKYK